MTQTLTGHTDIQNWVTARAGQPAIRRVTDRTGTIGAKLAIRFRRAGPPETASLDDGMSPCSWTAWFAELDRQELALRIVERNKQPSFEFVSRH